ncbi:LysR substrate-binding domain-containing protein [Rhizobium lusitanum]|uniref:DNA-binding transcriptional LysR family regulator n=1 Tax=Rhizobium lusitanum TaxID=293958 RepID=A0A7X0IQ49_9HYPH|nr:LysR substrate-binding domain-containing protein [Rhizobium lusitanum]MBB6484633.1 DNA-binding transcriptional LysR family regulator [Rhizobium lusitanum]
MDLSSIEIFLAVASDNSVTKAAKVLGRAPSNVTTRIQLLEEYLGVLLFSRDGKKMTLTQEGETFRTYANQLAALALEARQAVRSLRPSGSLRLGAMESTAASRLPAALNQFKQMWPDVSLKLSLGASRDLTRDVLDGALDCALIARLPDEMLDEGSGFETELEELEAEPVFVEHLLLVLPSGHPPIHSAADLRIETIAALEPGCTYRRIAERWASRSSALQTAEVGSYHAILASVAAGNAAGVMPKSVLDLMHWPMVSSTHQLATVDTMLISRRQDRPNAFNAFREVLVTAKASGSRRVAH